MATPVVSGAVADLLEAQPGLTPDQVKARLMKTAYKNVPASSSVTDPTTGSVYVDDYDIFTVGAGHLDIQAALADTSLATGTALSPTASVDPTTGNVYLVADPSSVWDTRAVWGNQSVWGARAVGATQSSLLAATPFGAARLYGERVRCGEMTRSGAAEPSGEPVRVMLLRPQPS